MATEQELADFRTKVCKGIKPSFNKLQLNAVYDALDVWFDSKNTERLTVIGNASSHIFTLDEKTKRIIPCYLQSKLERER